MPTIPFDELENFAIQLLHAGGTTEEEAEIVGKSLVQANMLGYDSHGVMRIPFYLDMLKAGDTVSGVELTVLTESPTNIVADANWGFGRVQTGRLTERLIEKAKATGTAVGTLRHSSHIGRLGEYCEICADEGLVSVMMVNTHGAARRVAPVGGIEPRLGTNPMAFGVPDADTPLILDFSTSATAEGKVRVKAIAGEQCPDGWLLDSQGRPTNDPNDLYSEPPGTILPMGGDQAYKGFGLSLMIDVFAGALSGGLVARETPITPKGNCLFLMVLSPDAYGGADHFANQVSSLIEFVRSCPTADGVDRIMMPGDPERMTKRRKLESGLVFDDENWNKLLGLADTLGVATTPETA